MHPRTLGLLAVIVFLLGGSGAYLVKWLDQRAHRAGADYYHSLPDFRFPDPWGEPHSNAEWAGNVVVLYFWATWCEECIDEMADLEHLAERYHDAGLRVVGIAIDTPSATAIFAQDMDIEFPLLVADMRGAELARRLGDRLLELPFTAVFDPPGRLVATHVGAWNHDERRPLLEGLLQKARH